LLLFVLGVRPEAIDNRRAADFPSLGDGWGFFTGLAPWASDNLPLRDVAIHAHGDISEGLFGELPKFSGSEQSNGPLGAPPPPVTQPQQPSEPGPADWGTSGFPTVIQGRDGWMYFGYDTKGKCEPVKPLAETIANLQRLRTAVEKSGRKFVLAVAPDKTTMVPEYLPGSYAGKSCSADLRADFWRRAVTDLRVLDLRVPLNQEAARNRGPVYFPQDSHWTFAGGLTLTREMAERLQPGVSSSWRIASASEWSAPADLPRLIGRSGVSRTNRFELGPDGGADRTDWSPSDLQKPLQFTKTPSEGMISLRTAIVADSFGSFATPFIGATFTDVSITHVGEFTKDARPLINRLADAKIVVFEIVERNLAAGASPISDPRIVDQISGALAARPVG
jgi:alginate O-acetyltransferase complex protein AlgJ